MYPRTIIIFLHVTSRVPEKRKREDGGYGGNDEVVQIKQPRKE